MKNNVKIDGKILLKNSALNLIGQIIPLVIAVFGIPLIIRNIGNERFGLLSIALIVLGYFTIFDLGLGRATVKFVAETLSRDGDENVSKIIWTAITIQAIFGLLGAFILVGLTPTLVNNILNITTDLKEEAKIIFYLLAISVPIILMTGSLSGVLEAIQRFDLINAIKIPTNSMIFLLPLVGAVLGFSLPIIVLMIIISKFLALFIYFFIGIRFLPELKKYSISYSIFRQLFSFGGWVMISSFISPILVYFDRFFIASIISMTAVTFYTAPYEAITRLLIIPTSMTMTLFPAFSTLSTLQEKERIESIFFSSLKFILLFLGPIIIIIGVFANDILQIWLGNVFASKSTLLLKILSIGVLFNSLAQFPFALLQGIGRPDLPAKFHLIELIFYIGMVLYLVKNCGINGAAMAWTIRVSIDTLLLFVGVFKIYRPKLNFANLISLVWPSATLIIFSVINYLLRSFGKQLGFFSQTIFIAALLIVLFWLFWLKFDNKVRKLLINMIK